MPGLAKKARDSGDCLTSLSAADREVYARARRQRRAWCRALSEHDPDLLRANALDIADRAACVNDLRSGRVERHGDDAGHHALGRRRRRRRACGRSDGVDERELVTAREDGGAEVGGAAVNPQKPGVRTGRAIGDSPRNRSSSAMRRNTAASSSSRFSHGTTQLRHTSRLTRRCLAAFASERCERGPALASVSEGGLWLPAVRQVRLVDGAYGGRSL